MIRIKVCLFALLCMAFSNIALAANAAPFGLELGIADFAQLEQQLGSKTSLSEAGVHRATGGRVFKSDGGGLGIDGLSDVLFIFDKSGKLAGVVMTLPKESFKPTLKTLSAKYKLVSSEVPFVGDATARLKQGDSIIQMEAPHMSFSMDVLYLTNALEQAFKKMLSNDRAAKEKKQADMF